MVIYIYITTSRFRRKACLGIWIYIEFCEMWLNFRHEETVIFTTGHERECVDRSEFSETSLQLFILNLSSDDYLLLLSRSTEMKNSMRKSNMVISYYQIMKIWWKQLKTV